MLPSRLVRRRFLALTELETRDTPSFATVGPENPVSVSPTLGRTTPDLAADPAGDYVIVWASDGQDGDGGGIYAQRFNSSGAAQGGEFRVNTTTAGEQRLPSVAMDATGDFVVAWQSNDAAVTASTPGDTARPVWRCRVNSRSIPTP